MAQNVNFTLHGLKELNEALKTLPEIIGRQVAINVLTEVSEPMLAEARSTAAFVDRSGKLRKSIKAVALRRSYVRKRRGSRGDVFQLRVGPTSPLAHLIENGTKPHLMHAKEGSVLAAYNRVIGKEIKHPGTKPRPFFRPAWDRHAPTMFSNLKTIFWKELDAAAATLARKATAGKLPASIGSKL